MTNYTYEMRGDSYVIKNKKKEIPPSRVCQILNTKWSRMARQLLPKQHSIILVKKPKGMGEEDAKEFDEMLQLMADEILMRFSITCFLVGVEQLSDFHLITEENMNDNGWVRSEKVLAMVTDSFEKLANANNLPLDEEE